MAQDIALRVEVEREAAVATIRFETGRPLNALQPAALGAIADAIAQVDSDSGIVCAVLTGTREAFSAGADLDWMHQQTPDSMIEYAGGAWPRIRQAGLPIVGAVNGWALGGGCELALACDCIVAADDAVFGLPETGLGLIPGGGGTQRLARVVGRQLASEIVLAGRRLTPDELLTLGLVNRVVTGARCVSTAQEVAREIASRPRHAVRLAKRAVTAAEELPLEAAMEHERRLFELAFVSDERRQRTEAYLARRAKRSASAPTIRSSAQRPSSDA